MLTVLCILMALRVFEALLKRGYHGVFHHFSDKHIGRYVDEFVFRLNNGNVKRSTLDRIDSIVFGFSGNRLSYKMLVLKKGTNLY